LVKKGCLKKNKNNPLSRFECFGHAKTFLICVKLSACKIAINGKYFKNVYDNPNYHALFVIFQTYKNVILKSVHLLGWLL
jgi:hypothetical protein